MDNQDDDRPFIDGEVRPHLSASSLGTLARCGLQFMYRYMEGIKSPPGVAMLMGGAAHVAVEADLKSKLADGKLLKDKHIQQIAAEALDEKWEKDEPQLTAEEQDKGEKNVKGDAKDATVNFAMAHHTLCAPTIEPTHVERKLVLPISDKYDMLAFVDVQEENRIRDTKTTSRTPKKDTAEVSTQLTVYSMMIKEIDGKAPETVHLDHLVKSKGGVKHELRSGVRTEANFVALKDRIKRAEDVISKGAFYPTDSDNWACDPRWCGYWGRCPQGAKQRTQG